MASTVVAGLFAVPQGQPIASFFKDCFADLPAHHDANDMSTFMDDLAREAAERRLRHGTAVGEWSPEKSRRQDATADVSRHRHDRRRSRSPKAPAPRARHRDAQHEAPAQTLTLRLLESDEATLTALLVPSVDNSDGGVAGEGETIEWNDHDVAKMPPDPRADKIASRAGQTTVEGAPPFTSSGGILRLQSHPILDGLFQSSSMHNGSAMRFRGVCKLFNAEKGFGFVEPDRHFIAAVEQAIVGGGHTLLQVRAAHAAAVASSSSRSAAASVAAPDPSLPIVTAPLLPASQHACCEDLFVASSSVVDCGGVRFGEHIMLCVGEELEFEVGRNRAQGPNSRPYRALRVTGPNRAPVRSQNPSCRRRGLLRYWSAEREYGFVTPDEPSELALATGKDRDVFLHLSMVVWHPSVPVQDRALAEGMVVEYCEVDPNAAGNGRKGAGLVDMPTDEGGSSTFRRGGRILAVCVTDLDSAPLDPATVRRRVVPTATTAVSDVGNRTSSVLPSDAFLRTGGTGA